MRPVLALFAVALGGTATAATVCGAGAEQDPAPGPPAGSPATTRAASITVIPATVRAGAHLVVRGRSFAGGRAGVVRLGGGRRAGARTNARGRFAVRMPVRRDARAGPRRLTVRIGRHRLVTVVRITSSRAPPSALVAHSGGERVVLAPSSGVARSRFRLRGTGFRHAGPVRVRFEGARGRTASVGAGGRFSIFGRVPSSRPGVRHVTVRWGGRRMAIPFVLRAGRPAPPVVAAAGDIACDPSDPAFGRGDGRGTDCRQRATARLVRRMAPAAVLPLGDTQYESGALADYRASYARTWGRFNAIAHPVPGDDEYKTPHARGYFAYFGARAGRRGGYYSFNVGAWHLIALNSNCAHVSCAAGSTQERWLRADLAAHARDCTLAYWHESRFESGVPPQATDTGAFWDDLYAAGADVVLGGHAHVYERFAPQAPSRARDPARGLRQFVVGTGGRSLQRFTTARPNSEVRIAHRFGVLALTLRPGGYAWRFVGASGRVLDAGSARCH